MEDWNAITREIGSAIDRPVKVREIHRLSGGSINEAVVLTSDQGRYFVKRNAADRAHMFIAEAEGLRALTRTQTIRVPKIVCCGATAETSYLVLEYLDLKRGSAVSDEKLGQQLAALHQVTHSTFGWHEDNTIGSTRQPNSWADSWIDFWRTRRIGFQLELSRQNGYERLAVKGERLLDRLERLFADHVCAPSLCHGDLWSGNVGATPAGEPIVFDPAVYYGDRETDIAMSQLFGGFTDAFYAAYQEAWPLPAGYELRRSLYNLYHVLNHVNLFGGSYSVQAERLIERLLADAQ